MSLINILKGRAKVWGGMRKAVTTVTNLKSLIFVLYINTLQLVGRVTKAVTTRLHVTVLLGYRRLQVKFLID
ncbi:hypothetical protein OkiPb00429_22920 [Escherichia coli]